MFSSFQFFNFNRIQLTSFNVTVIGWLFAELVVGVGKSDKNERDGQDDDNDDPWRHPAFPGRFDQDSLVCLDRRALVAEAAAGRTGESGNFTESQCVNDELFGEEVRGAVGDFALERFVV